MPIVLMKPSKMVRKSLVLRVVAVAETTPETILKVGGEWYLVCAELETINN